MKNCKKALERCKILLNLSRSKVPLLRKKYFW